MPYTYMHLMSQTRPAAERIHSELARFCSDIRLTELRSVYTIEFRLNGRQENFASSMVVSKDSGSVTELCLRFPPVTTTSEMIVNEKLDAAISRVRPPVGTTSRVQPRKDGTYAPHIILKNLSVTEALAYARQFSRAYNHV